MSSSTSSPLRTLVTRHICNCSHSNVPNSARSIRTFSTQPVRLAYVTSPSASPGIGATAEDLKRRYRPIPKSTSDAQAGRAAAYKRMRRSGYGIFACAVGMGVTVWYYNGEVNKQSKSSVIQNDAPPSIGTLGGQNSDQAQEVEQVPTGTSTIPFFPKVIYLPSSTSVSTGSTSPSQSSATSSASPITNSITPAPITTTINSGPEEYQLLGLGIRTVSLFSIQVYVVGLYISTSTVHKLQEKLVHQVNPNASALIPDEKSDLRTLLLDPEKGEQVWNSLLTSGELKTAIRIVPTRNTDFMHMRDGFVRGITARSKHFENDLSDGSFRDEKFGESLNEFKQVFGGGGKKKIPKEDILVLLRDEKGAFEAWFEDRKGDRAKLGSVMDERISRLLWLGYLGGKSVSSEDARRNIIDGCIDLVERPVGTVEGQVV